MWRRTELPGFEPDTANLNEAFESRTAIRVIGARDETVPATKKAGAAATRSTVLDCLTVLRAHPSLALLVWSQLQTDTTFALNA